MSRDEALTIITGIFRSILDDDELLLGEDTKFEDIEGFDSIMQITLIGSVESEFGKRFPLREMAGLKTVQQLIDIVTGDK